MTRKGFKVYTTIKTIIDVIFILIIALYIAVVLIQRFSGNKSVFGYRMYNVASESMVPVYKVNDIIAVKDCDTATLKVGDDIAYRGEKLGLGGKIITHRIIKIEDNNGVREITTKGVNNALSDPPITTKQVVGKVVGVVPIISSINAIVMTQAGFFFLVFVPIVLMACMEIAETIIDNKLEKKELIKSPIFENPFWNKSTILFKCNILATVLRTSMPNLPRFSAALPRCLAAIPSTTTD